MICLVKGSLTLLSTFPYGTLDLPIYFYHDFYLIIYLLHYVLHRVFFLFQVKLNLGELPLRSAHTRRPLPSNSPARNRGDESHRVN